MWRMVIFGVLASSVWAAVHIYLGRHILGALKLKGRANLVGWGLVAGHGVLAPIAMIARRGSMGGAFWDALNLATYVGMGFVALMFIVFLTIDIARLGLRIVEKIGGRQPDPERRQFLTGSVNLGAFALTGVATGVGFQKATKIPDIKEVTIEVPGLHANL